MRTLVFFGLGVYLGLRLIAALFRIVDLWYRIGTSWPLVARGLAGWGGATALAAALAGEASRPAFVWGLGAYAALFVSQDLALRLFLRGRRSV